MLFPARMWNTIALILPILVPSWRFFKSIEPSPRIEWAPIATPVAAPEWRKLRARPQRVSLWQMMRRLFWNPEWNRSLFLVSCAERIQQAPTNHSIDVIKEAVRAESAAQTAPAQRACFRIVSVSRHEAEIVKEVLFTSDPFSVHHSALQ